MRKYILLFILSFFHVLSRGQTPIDIDLSGIPEPTHAESIKYWFDDDAESLSTSPLLNGSYTLDTSSLLDGLHTIHYQIVDDKGLVASPSTAIFMKISERSAEKQGTATQLNYWFDNLSSVASTSTVNGIMTLDVSSLLDGLHTIHYQITDDSGAKGYIESAIFMKMNTPFDINNDPVTAKKLMYWFDNETDLRSMDITTGIQMLDASHLLDGLHTLHYQVICSDGTITSAASTIFMRMNVTIEDSAVLAKSLRYWFDNSNDVKLTEITGETQLLDASALLDGLHTIHYQVVDENGEVGCLSSSIFMKMDIMTSENRTSAKKQRIWFDNDKNTLLETDIAGGTQVLDASQLQMGLHTVHYQLIDDNGDVSAPHTALFMKTENLLGDGDNSITGYIYWLNDKSEGYTKVNIKQPVSPYNLVSLLPVPKAPIRSSSFQFEVKDNVPIIYAKNDLHVRFEDARGYWTDDSRSFIDYSVSQQITGFKQLLSTQSFTRPNTNEIEWFRFDAAPGDTIAFKASQATTVQVFAPSGKEIYVASGDKSVVYGGAHTWEDGTYYVAVHDVTGSRSNITLDYMHMDKYDVVNQDVRAVGNGGCSTITYQGNGFKDLYAVDLYTAQGDTIHSIHVGHESDAETSVTFDFTDAKLGKYNALFHFAEEDKMFADNISVEEAKDIKLETKISYPPSFLRGSNVTYKVSITNKGNMTAYKVPINTNIKCKKQIVHIKFNGIDYVDLMESINTEGLTKQEIAEIRDFVDSIGDGHLLNTYRIKDEHDSDSAYVKNGYIFINLPPNSTTNISINIKANDNVDVDVTTPTEWPPVDTDRGDDVVEQNSGSPSFVDKYCCIAENIECFLSIAVSGLDIASMGAAVAAVAGPEEWPAGVAIAFADCTASAASNLYHNINYIICKGHILDDLKNNLTSKISLLNVLLSCAGTITSSVKAIKALLAVGSTAVVVNDFYLDASCFSDMLKGKSNCPDNANHRGGISNSVASLDPNDIFGYTSVSGSQFIADDIVELNYRIEFENDTTFATASAHTVLVTDTLDATKFDLASYQPTYIKIGDKDVQLKGDKEFVTTVDMRPEINAIAQVEGMYDEKKGIATWKFTSLDPMTMEETDDIMQGFLPVNFDGSGIGEVAYNINRKSGLADGTEISNKASIIFDNNDAILTPVWTNTIDAVPPTSHVSQLEIVGNDSVCVHFEGTDERSGVWKYELYVQHGEGSGWWKEAETDSTCCGFRFYNNIKYSFCVLATDSAGNVERKEFAPEKILYVGRKGDVNTDGEVNVTDIVYVADHILGNVDEAFNASAADINDDKEINVTDIVYIADEILNGDVDQRSAVKSNRARTVTNSADALTIEPFNIDSGETKVVTLEMNNPGYDITAFQCDVTLPNGLHIAKSGNGKQGVSFNKDTKRADASTHSLTAMSRDAGVNRLVCYSITNEPFFGYTGGVIDIPVTADATMADGEYTVLIDNITMTCKDKTQLKPAPVMVKISVNNATSVHSLNADDPSAEYYDVGGRKRDTISKGVNIVRKNDNVNKVIK